MKQKLPVVGDVFQVPLLNGGHAQGQYLQWDPENGPLCRIFSKDVAGPIAAETMDHIPLLFPPVFIGFGDSFAKRGWRVIGHAPICSFTFPRFRYAYYQEPGVYHNWKLYDGKTFRVIGDLPPDLRSLEFLCGWSPQAIEERIRTGENPYDGVL